MVLEKYTVLDETLSQVQFLVQFTIWRRQSRDAYVCHLAFGPSEFLFEKAVYFDHILGRLTLKLTIIVNLLFQKWYQIRGEYSGCSKLLSTRSRFIIVLDQVKH